MILATGLLVADRTNLREVEKKVGEGLPQALVWGHCSSALTWSHMI